MAKRKFVLLRGNHSEYDTPIRPGVVFESEVDLVKVHGEGKFRYADPPAPTAQELNDAAKEVDLVQQHPANVVTSDKSSKKKKKYEDVTAAFPDVNSEEFIVFRDSDMNYYVATVDSPKVYLNEAPLKEVEVVEFVQTQE